VTGLPPARTSVPEAPHATPPPDAPPPRGPAGGIAALAAAATPVVAAALIAVAVIGTGCRARPPTSQPSVAPAAPHATAAARHGEGPVLLLVVAGPARPRATLLDVTRPDDPGLPVDLPDRFRAGGLAAVVAAPDGRLAAIDQGGAAWVAPARATGSGEWPRWTPLPAGLPAASLPGPVLGATWSVDGTSLVLIAGAPGSGTRRTTIITVPLDGGRATSVEVLLEADGPAVAALPRGVVAFVGRGLDDRGSLARIAAAGSLATLPIAARSVVAGGGMLAIADDATVLVGTLADLEQGVLPTQPLPLAEPGGIGAVAIAPDGSAVAVVRLDDEGVAARVEVVRRVDGGWATGSTIALEAGDVTAVPAWLPRR